jgi:hypothetical protein
MENPYASKKRSFSQTEEKDCNAESCDNCFKRHVVGAPDVCNVRLKLRKAMSMQEKYIEKHADKEKKPPTYDTRLRLRNFLSDVINEFELEFENQLPEFADQETLNKINERKRMRT